MRAPTEAGAVDGDELLEQMRTASGEGLAANFRRFVEFRGWADGEAVELQALHVPDGYRARNLSAHATSPESAIRLLEEIESRKPQGIYVIGNRIHPAVATRQAPDQWIEMQKGGSTSDDEITHRTLLYVDVDYARPKTTSTTTAELAVALDVLARVQHFVEAAIGERTTATCMSGNGGALFAALDSLASTPELTTRVRAVLEGLQLIYQTTAIKIDCSVSDPKRLMPCAGTVKRKGSPGIPSRPHRRIAILTPTTVRRVGLADLDRLLDAIRAELVNDEQRQKFDKARRVKVMTPTATSSTTAGDETPWKRANACDVVDVLQRLNKLDGEHPVCTGCGLSGDSSVAIISNGVKCSHARCSTRGRSGYRTPIDLVVEALGVSPIEAVRTLGTWFGFAVEPGKKTTTHVRTESPLDAAIQRGDRKRALEIALALYRQGAITRAEALAKLSEIRQ